jgi:hypothetical protein
LKQRLIVNAAAFWRAEAEMQGASLASATPLSAQKESAGLFSCQHSTVRSEKSGVALTLPAALQDASLDSMLLRSHMVHTSRSFFNPRKQARHHPDRKRHQPAEERGICQREP